MAFGIEAFGIDRVGKYGALLALTAVLGCSGGTTADKGPKDGDDDDDDDDTTTTTDSDTGGGTAGYPVFDPAAVGFEVDAVVLANQELAGYIGGPFAPAEGEVSPPTVFLTFASADFFGATSTAQQAEESCWAFGTFYFPLPLIKPAQIPVPGALQLYQSWDGALAMEYTNCAGRVDPTVWGENAEYMWGPFHGAHFGIGFGPMTDYLLEAWAEETITDLGDAMVAEYIAINDANGDFVGSDWTTAIAFEYDPDTQTLVTDADDLLQKVPLDALEPGDDLPEAYFRSFSYWYQDFPYMDFSNLADGAPPLP